MRIEWRSTADQLYVGITTVTSGASAGTGGERLALARIAPNLLVFPAKDATSLPSTPCKFRAAKDSAIDEA